MHEFDWRNLPRRPLLPRGEMPKTHPAWGLPRVASIANFLVVGGARDRSESFSSMVVIWFQEGFGNPNQDILRQIAAIDWDALAHDWSP